MSQRDEVDPLLVGISKDDPLTKVVVSIKDEAAEIVRNVAEIVSIAHPIGEHGKVESSIAQSDNHIQSLQVIDKAERTSKAANEMFKNLEVMKNQIVTGSVSAIHYGMLDEKMSMMKSIQEIEYKMEKMRDEVAMLLSSLEYHYYSAPLRFRPNYNKVDK